MKRKDGESFEDYKKRRKEAAEDLKARLKGRRVFQSNVFTMEKDPDTGEEKLKRTGQTFVRGKNSLTGSIADANRYQRMLKKAERKAKRDIESDQT